MLLRNIGVHLQGYMESQPRRPLCDWIRRNKDGSISVNPAVFLEQPIESSRGPLSLQSRYSNQFTTQGYLSQYLFIYFSQFLSSVPFPMFLLAFSLSLLTYIFLSINIRVTVRRTDTYHLPTTRHDSPSVCTRECRLASYTKRLRFRGLDGACIWRARFKVPLLWMSSWAPVPDALPCFFREYCPTYQYCLRAIGRRSTVAGSQNFR